MPQRDPNYRDPNYRDPNRGDTTHRDFADKAVQDWSQVLPTLVTAEQHLTAAVRLSRVAKLQDELDDRVLRNYDRSGVRGADDFRALALLRRTGNEGMTNAELVDQLGGSKAGMSNRLDRFAQQGLLKRIPSEVDRRTHSNLLTDLGNELADELVTTVVAARSAMFEQLTPTQVADLAQTLGDIIHTLDPHG